jgi:hypothetical protein
VVWIDQKVPLVFAVSVHQVKVERFAVELAVDDGPPIGRKGRLIFRRRFIRQPEALAAVDAHAVDVPVRRLLEIHRFAAIRARHELRVL